MRTLFISDLHLDPANQALTNSFQQFYQYCLRHSDIERIFILGDLFEVWIGDDISLDMNRTFVQKLKELAAREIAIYIMHGNRDFLMGQQFAQYTGCSLITDPFILKTSQGQILLSHGDMFCIDDKEYMQFRQQVRGESWQQTFLALPPEERIEIARNYRQESKAKGQQRTMEIMDANQSSIEEVMVQHGIYTLIHGHTHRPSFHEFIINGHAARRIVLPDWHPDGKFLELSQDGLSPKFIKFD